ncbi:MAG TPA: von Willebrand factor type A domain-containing protein [Verrucomicrobiae bacterium]|jgi:Mg-chelatase subunit ChlD|nr:von Willebrand factor type A domain-containing protein [Verrucomicrobiae bacterium]
MNPDFPQNEREQLETKLTAFLLGELPPDETVALCKAMESDPELAALYERLKQTIELVRESAASPVAESVPQTAPLKMSANRREKLLAQFKTIAPKEFAKPRRVMDWLVPVAAVSAMIMILAALLLPALSRAKSKAQKSSVINNLRLLDGAKQQWALETGARADAEPTFEQIKPYLGRGSSENVSIKNLALAGETYVLGKVSEAPKVEASVREARRLFGKDALANAEIRDGKALLSLLPPDTVQMAQQGAPAPPPLSTTNPQSSVLAQRESQQDNVVLPAGGQVADNFFGMVTNDSAGEISQAANPPSAGNKFVARYAYIALPPGQTLGLGAIQPQTNNAGEQIPLNYAFNSDISTALNTFSASDLRDYGDHSAQWNFSAGTPLESTLAFKGDSYDSNTVYRTFRMLGADSESDKPAITFSNFTPSVSEVSMPSIADANVNVARRQMMNGTEAHFGRFKSDEVQSGAFALSNAMGRVPILGDVPMVGGLFPSDNKLSDANGIHGTGIITMAPLSAGSATTPAEAGRKTEIVLPPASQEYSKLQANGGPMLETRPVGAGGGRPDLRASTKSTPLLTGKQVEIAAAANDNRAVGLNWELNNNMEPNGARSFDPATGQPVVAMANPLADPLASFSAAKEALENEKRLRTVIATRATQEEVDKDLPRERMVTVVDPAQASQSEKPSLGEKLRETFSGKVERTARIAVEQEYPDIAGVAGAPASQGYDPYFLLTEFQTIQSHPVLSKVVSSLKLNEEWAKKYNRGQPLTESQTEELIKRHLDLHSVANTKEIAIGVKSESPDEAARIANAVANAYRQYRADEYEDLKNHGIKNLQQQITDEDKKIKLAQAKVDKLAGELKVYEGEQPTNDAALPKPAVSLPTPQPEILTRENASSTFSLNVSDVSFKLAAASLEKGQMPEPASIRSEEFINAFDYRDPAPAPGVPIAFASERAGYPFAHNRELLRFSLKTAAAGRQAGRPLNIVLLLDNSGSMERADRVRIIQEALRVLAGQLQAQDTFSVVTFARTARLQVDGIPGNQAAAAATEIAKLTPEGGTNLGEALDLAYETALHHYLANGDNRVVMLTDGAANLGDVSADTLKQKVEAHRKQGVALDCFGIGWEGYNDDLLEVLTRNGDGRYGFINTPEEAGKEFVAQIAGALHVAASDVKVQVEFNPKRVVSYRQIGYAKHQLTKEQFRDNTVDAAEIAAQEAGNALYTIETNPQGEGSVATVRVRYKVPGTPDYREQAWDVPYTGSAVALEQGSPAMRLAATASAFSEWLATSPFAAEVSPDQLLRYLNGVPQVYGADARPTKLEWMIRQAKSISGK